MEIRRLDHFVAVVDEGGFTRAAERLHVAQPGVSARVGRLERELGAALLDRSGRTVRTTEAGAAALPFARAVLAAPELRVRLGLVWCAEGTRGPAARELAARARSVMGPGRGSTTAGATRG
jgi:hypothetical protein